MIPFLNILHVELFQFLSQSCLPCCHLRGFFLNMTATQTTSAQLCVDLHNRLVRRLPHPVAASQIRRDLVTTLQAQEPDLYNDLQGTALLQFLSGIDNYDSEDGRYQFTPQVRKPDPSSFLSYRMFDVAGEYPAHVLLYPDAESGNSGGIIYDPTTDLATWAFFPPWPRPSEWVPLSDILTKWMEQWDSGKFFWDAEIGSLAVHSWVSQDVDEAVEAWTALLNAITTRLPTSTPPQTSSNEPTPSSPVLPLQQLERANFHPFATAFLSRATRPGNPIKYIAPGLTTWTPDSFTRDIENEPPSSPRRQYLARRRGVFDIATTPVLLFPFVDPSSTTQPLRVIEPIPPGTAERSFDAEWGFGKFTLDRRAGVYVYPHPESGGGGSVVVVEGSGRDDWGQWGGRCPWGPGSPARLAEVLGRWKGLVEDGSWRVGAEGVEGGWR